MQNTHYCITDMNSDTTLIIVNTKKNILLHTDLSEIQLILNLAVFTNFLLQHSFKCIL